MIPVKRLTIGMQYWFICNSIKVFGRYKGHDKNIINISDAFIYFLNAQEEDFCIEQYFLLDASYLLNIKIDDSEPDNDYSEHYQAEAIQLK